jgi:ribosomal protein S18 acetylase RimI-like enzyme
MIMSKEIRIINFDENLSRYFRDLNVAWLQKYFYVEPVDVEMLDNPKQYIIDKGGDIYFAKWEESIAGTFALMKEGEGVYELGKMAVDETFQGKGVGNALLRHCLAKAKEKGARKVILFSNTVLEPAIHLYRKFGFVEVPLGNSDYKRSNIKMEREV